MVWKLILYLYILLLRSSVVSSNYGPGVDHLQALGLAPPWYQFWDYEVPSENDIKTAYKAQSLLYHPDKNYQPDAMDKFIAIRNAYEELKGTGYEADKRRIHAASKYRHHGAYLRAVKYHIHQLPNYANVVYNQYVLVIWWYTVALWKEFINNPYDSWNRLIFNWKRLSMKDTVIALIVVWISWKVCGFIGFTVRRKVKNAFSLSDKVVFFLFFFFCFL